MRVRRPNSTGRGCTTPPADEYSGGGGGGLGYGYGIDGWSRDYPKADRQSCRRSSASPASTCAPMSRSWISTATTSSIYPWVYAVQVANWSFTDAEAKRLRDYLLKGGFLMVDDFHGTEDWERFMTGMRQFCRIDRWRILPTAMRSSTCCTTCLIAFQIPGEQYVNTGRTYEKDGYVPKWRAIRDTTGPASSW